ncbi:MAG: lipocalin-like domain-containing protein [Anaerolineae bacterium]|jgi:predicted secreted hydrolase
MTMGRWVRILMVAGFVVVLVGVVALIWPREESFVQARLIAPDSDSTGYLRAEGPMPLDFPAAHGPHPEYQTEWWYYTGNVQTDAGRAFGYQLTFFRRALAPPDQRPVRESAWATDQVYMAHLALTDVAEERYQAFERFSRGAAGLAGAQAVPYRVWLEDWSVEEVEPGVILMRAAQDDVALELRLADSKGPILHGDRGFSPKGPQPGNASYYYSLTRLETSGRIRIGDESHEVRGLSWMDHEFSTSGLAADQVGWDWFSMQIDDGSELMVFQLRTEDGGIDPYSSGTFIAPDGATRTLDRSEFEIRVTDTWRSPHTGAVYPAGWTIAVPAVELELEIEPYIADQELTVSYAYWEGAVWIEGERAGRPVRGAGYIEMTGYAASMQGQF